MSQMDSSIMEQFTLNPFHEIYDPYEYFKEDCDFLEYLKEDTIDGIPKKSLLKKIKDLLVNAVKRIIKTIGKIISWVKGLFVEPREAKTVDQILEELGCPRSDRAKDPNRKAPWMHTSNIQTAMKPFVLKMKENGDLEFSVKDYIVNTVFPSKQEVLTNQHPGTATDPRAFMIAMKFIREPKLMLKLVTVAEDVSKGGLNPITVKLIDDIHKEAVSGFNVNFTYTITMRQLQEFNKQMLVIHDKLAILDDPTMTVKNNNKDTLKILNKLFSAVLNLQIGSAMLGTCMRNVYVIDPEYCETIDNPDVLGAFVDRLLKIGAPDKYIAFNIWMACTPKVRGEAKAEYPLWGFSRVTFLPLEPDNVVYKMAINGWGVRSNIIEKKISDAVYAAGVGEHFAKILDIHKSNSMVIMERAHRDKSKAIKYKNQVKDECQKALFKAGIRGEVDDCSEANVGFRGDIPVNIDYGTVKRIAVD